jgi:hypothetical protein
MPGVGIGAAGEMLGGRLTIGDRIRLAPGDRTVGITNILVNYEPVQTLDARLETLDSQISFVAAEITDESQIRPGMVAVSDRSADDTSNASVSSCQVLLTVDGLDALSAGGDLTIEVNAVRHHVVIDGHFTTIESGSQGLVFGLTTETL